MNIPRNKHLELQRAGFLCSQSLGIVHILLFLCSSAFSYCFVTLFPVRTEKSKHFGNSAQQPEVRASYLVLYLAGARDLFSQLLQATGKKNNIFPAAKLFCVFALQLLLQRGAGIVMG